MVTADMAIYSKAQQILSAEPESLSRTGTVKLGGIHLTMAFIASFGKLFRNGLHHIFTASNVYADCTTSLIYQGK